MMFVLSDTDLEDFKRSGQTAEEFLKGKPSVETIAEGKIRHIAFTGNKMIIAFEVSPESFIVGNSLIIERNAEIIIKVD